MRWFRGSAEKKRRDKYRSRRVPRTPKTPKTKEKSIRPVRRQPKIERPVAEVPFAMPGKRPREPKAGLGRNAVSHPDYSLQALNTIEEMKSGDPPRESVEVRWINPTRSEVCQVCTDLESETWTSVEEFIGTRKSTSGEPEAGIMGHSHPGCDCELRVHMNDGSVYRVTTMSPEPEEMVPPTSTPVVEEPGGEGETVIF